MKKTVILLGKGTLAVRVAQWFHQHPDYELVRVVPVMPEPTWTESLSAWCAANGVPTVTSGHFKDLLEDPSLQRADGKLCDIGFSVFYDKIIRASFIDRCGQILNLHNGPLPRYRGVSPINWALKNGESEHGVTIHEITPGVDDGPIVGQVKYSIYPNEDEVKDVYGRAQEFGWTLFQQTMPILSRIQPQPQDHALATFYHSRQNVDLGDRRDFTRKDSLARKDAH
jgi:methionyl-tRNA formyltransferase